MSDFLNDDFTAELKNYFLSQLLTEAVQYQNAVDEDCCPIFCIEIQEKSLEWVVDAKTNEFGFFATWLEECVATLGKNPQLDFFKQSMLQIEKYLQLLLEQKKDSLDLAQSFSVLVAKKSTDLYMLFQIESQNYALLTEHIIEVVGDKKITHLPQPVDGLCGMMAYRGAAIPVLTLDSCAGAPPGNRHYYIICEWEKGVFALRVSQVENLVEIAAEQLQATEGGENFFAAPFISHFTLYNNKSTMIFDLPKWMSAA